VIQELDVVVLTKDVPEEGLQKGDYGAVVMVHPDGRAYEVEFVKLNGETIAVATIPRDTLRPIDERDVPTTRRAAVA
jgi:hypothetical protein